MVICQPNEVLVSVKSDSDCVRPTEQYARFKRHQIAKKQCELTNKNTWTAFDTTNMNDAESAQPSVAALQIKPLTSPHRIREVSLIIAVCKLLTPAVQLLCCPGSLNGSSFPDVSEAEQQHSEIAFGASASLGSACTMTLVSVD